MHGTPAHLGARRSTVTLPRATRRFALLALTLALPFTAVARERAEIPQPLTWNLDDLFKTEADWVNAREALAARIATLPAHRGHLGDSAAALLKALDASSSAELALSRLSIYAESRSDEDTRAGRPRELKQAAERLAVELGTAKSWIRPELLALDAGKLRGFLAAEPRLAPWKVFIEDTLRWQPHTLGAGEEQLLAQAGNLADAGQGIASILREADLPYPTIELSTGQKVRVDGSAFALHRASPVKADRDLAFEAHFGALKGYERTFGNTLEAQVKAHLFTARNRKFGSALESALFRANVPTSVYTQLLADVRRNLPTLHRYLKLRQRMLDLPQLRYRDLYIPLVGKVELSYTPEQAQALTLEAFAPLGKAYTAAIQTGYRQRWTDYLPSTGKRSGAYSTGVWGVHPYQLLNYNGQYEDLSTLAHESGHSMHTFLANQAQPFPTADYPIFVAEVASTLNEALLFDYMMGKARDDATRLALLGNRLDGLRKTLFRQTQFAEFELKVHEAAERGDPVTGETLTALYLKIAREYYGHDLGICTVDDLIGIEWAFIPHFYYDFYVFQYATSIVASSSLASRILAEGKQGKTAARDAYLAMLSAGGSRFPIDLLKSAGVDMTTSAPFDAAMKEMNGAMDQIEKILARQPKAKKP
jgi:oligoendopeptidase F